MMSFFDHRDLEAAPILLELCNPVVFDSPQSIITFSWGSKKKRSIPSPSPSPLAASAEEDPEAQAQTQTQKVVVAAHSPVSPLSFSVSESDNNCNSLKNNVCFKRKREEWVEKRDRLSEQNKQLKRQLQIVNQYYLKQKDLNILLKTMKLQWENLDIRRQADRALVKPYPVDHQQDHHHHHHHHQPLIFDQTALRSGANKNGHRVTIQTVSFCGGVGGNSTRDKPGPLQIDLNLPAPESFVHVEARQPSDRLYAGNAFKNKTKEAIAAAEARQKRKEICRAKMIGSASSSISSYNILLPHNLR